MKNLSTALVTLITGFLMTGCVGVQQTLPPPPTPIKQVSTKNVEVTELTPDDARGYVNLGVQKNKEGDIQGALNAFAEAIKLDPKNSTAYRNRAVVRAGLENYEGALEDLNKSIELKSNSANVYIDRGIVKNKLKDFESGLQDLSKAIEMDPGNGRAYFNRASTQMELMNAESECADFRKAGQLGYIKADEMIKKYCNDTPKSGSISVDSQMPEVKIGK